MANKLFVGSLPYSVTDDQLQQLFTEAGAVASAKVIREHDTGRSKGFGFVEMSNDDEAKKAIELFNGKDFEGRTIVVNEARPQENRERRSFDNGDRGFNRNSY